MLTDPVDQHRSGRDATTGARAVLGELDHAADFGIKDAIVRDASFAAEVAIERHVAVFAVNRHRVLRLEEIDHLPQFVTSGVAGNVHALVLRAVDHGRATAEEIVDGAGHGFFVTGYRSRRNEYGIADTDPQLGMLSGRDARQRGGGFALAAGQHDHALLLRQFQHLFE